MYAIYTTFVSFCGNSLLKVQQAVTELVRRLRDPSRQDKIALVLANGGVLSYQHVICLSKDPRHDGRSYPEKNPLPERITDVPIPALTEHAEGEATIEVK